MFAKKHDISFGDFLYIFSLRGNKNFKETDILNAFKLLSGEEDEKISMEHLKKLLEETGVTDVEIAVIQ